ncbi:hypothetical protein EVAR_83993_1 [Eumeta japonica]|uniref:Uncharacterized protein n=1 Tax=Eumeta variegata TaxID=151549 RepID=A0A4C1VNN7_EUMVA|nr:hypothetical protein EVAR_83993_1 [Eumeta japonica]
MNASGISRAARPLKATQNTQRHLGIIFQATYTHVYAYASIYSGLALGPLLSPKRRGGRPSPGSLRHAVALRLGICGMVQGRELVASVCGGGGAGAGALRQSVLVRGGRTAQCVHLLHP